MGTTNRMLPCREQVLHLSSPLLDKQFSTAAQTQLNYNHSLLLFKSGTTLEGAVKLHLRAPWNHIWANMCNCKSIPKWYHKLAKSYRKMSKN